MGDLGKITITKNKDCDNKTYYSAYIYGIDAVIGGGDTRNEAKDELFGNIVFYVNYLVETNQKLKQQLAEKDIRIEELEGQFAYECECNMQLVDLQKQLEEKQKTIDEINKEFVQAVHDWKALCAEKDKEIEDWKQKTQTFLNRVNEQNYEIANNNPKQLAIQELEKVKNKCNGMYELWLDSNYKENMYNNEDIAGVFEDISVFTNDLIKKLKGE